jgi:hypothetical protein
MPAWVEQGGRIWERRLLSEVACMREEKAARAVERCVAYLVLLDICVEGSGAKIKEIKKLPSLPVSHM